MSDETVTDEPEFSGPHPAWEHMARTHDEAQMYLDSDDIEPGLLLEHQRLVGENRAKAEAIFTMWDQVILRPEIIEVSYLMSVLDFLVPPGSAERLNFEIAWQNRVTEMLDLLEQQLRAQFEVRKKYEKAQKKGKLLLPGGGGLVLPGQGG